MTIFRASFAVSFTAISLLFVRSFAIRGGLLTRVITPQMDAVLPGERLGTTEEFTCGNGTYERDGYVYSTLVGFPKKRASDDEKKVRESN